MVVGKTEGPCIFSRTLYIAVVLAEVVERLVGFFTVKELEIA